MTLSADGTASISPPLISEGPIALCPREKMVDVSTVTCAGTCMACELVRRAILTESRPFADLSGVIVQLSISQIGGANTATCTTPVSVIDSTPPTIQKNQVSPVNLYVGLDGNAVVDLAAIATISDNCGVESQSATPDSYPCQYAGTTQRPQLQATDSSNNVAIISVPVVH